MIRCEDVRTWPYGDFETIDIDCLVFDSTGVMAMPLTNLGAREPTSTRTAWDPDAKSHLSGSSLKGAYISNIDRNKGLQAEIQFAKRATALGLRVFALPHFSHNYKKHIDFEVEGMDGRSIWVDVKAPKALRKMSAGPHDPYAKPQDRYVGFHLQPTGDLFGSEADYVAFGLTDGSFLLGDRLKIKDIVETKLEGAIAAKVRSAWPETALWTPYYREAGTSQAVMSYMDLNDLKPALKWKL